VINNVELVNIMSNKYTDEEAAAILAEARRTLSNLSQKSCVEQSLPAGERKAVERWLTQEAELDAPPCQIERHTTSRDAD
jgi:hypothetical protein